MVDNKLTLIINSEAKADDLKTAAFPRRRSRRLGRRRNTRRVYLNVWDIARYAAGTTRADLNTRITPDGPASNIFAQDNDFNTTLFTTDYETWDSIFYNITQLTTDYSLSINSVGDYVPGKGLPHDPNSEVPLQVLSENLYFNTWIDEDHIRFTNDPDPEATPVDFVFDKNCDLFLAPSMFDRGATAFLDGSGTDTFWRVMPLKAPIPRTTVGDSTFSTIWDNRANSSAASVIDISYYRDLFLADASPQMFTWDSAVPSGPGTEEDPVDFPTLSDYPTVGDPSWNLRPRLTFHPTTRFDYHCFGAIRKHLTSGFEWYFIWSDEFITGFETAGIDAGSWEYGVTTATWLSPTPDANRGILV